MRELTEREWDVIAASHESRSLVHDMAKLLVDTNYKEGYKFVRNHMDSFWSAYLFEYARYLREVRK